MFCIPLQVPMSKFESDEYINDRYKAIEERLKVISAQSLLVIGS